MSRTKIRTMWQYMGDMNLECGGTFFEMSTLKWNYVNAVQVTDLESAVGFKGAMLIEGVVVCGFDDPERVKAAIGLNDLFDDSDKVKAEPSPLLLAEALLEYGPYDTERMEVIQCQNDGLMSFDGWTADKTLKETGHRTLKGYIKDHWLR